jgi:hypothetical protein
MKSKFLIALTAFFLTSTLLSQTNLNDYKYVILPRKYDFLKEVDKYQLNSLTKFLFEKENFNVFYDDESFPEDFSKDRCLALFANVLDDSKMFKTKLSVQLRDCNNNIVFTSVEGSSKEKNYKNAYHEALRTAFTSLQEVNYKYQPKGQPEIIEVKPPTTPKPEKPVVKEAPKNVIQQESKEPAVTKKDISDNTLYAQQIEKGFQLVDSTPKIVMKLVNTPKQDVYIVKGQDAIVYKEDGFWYIASDNKSVKSLNIKF